MKNICMRVGSFILSAAFVLSPILLGYGLAAHPWKSVITFLLSVIVCCEFVFVCSWIYAAAEEDTKNE